MSPHEFNVTRACFTSLWCLALASLAAPAPALDLSGSLGYDFRSFDTQGSGATVSNQLTGHINASSHLWQPWFANFAAGLNITMDGTEYDGGTSSNDTRIVTGDLNLNVLPQSKTPFQLTYQVTDSRVDTLSTDNPLVTFGEEFETQRLGIKQSYITDKGDRLTLRYDNNTWESQRSGTYDDETTGLDLDLRGDKHRLVGKTSVQTIAHSVSNRDTERLIVDVDHFYFASRNTRVDTFFSVYQTDDNFDVISPSLNGESSTDITQFSSFVFWRPSGRRISASGGFRLHGLQNEAGGTTRETQSASANAGALYQFSKNLRFDASLAATQLDNEGEETTLVSQERIGALYQSDAHSIFGGSLYQWYADSAVAYRDTGVDDQSTLDITLGHDLQRQRLRDKGQVLRISLSQVFDNTLDLSESESTSRLDHSATLAWDQAEGGKTRSIQLTAADTRDLSERDDSQQLVNFQLLLSRDLTRRSSFSGNLTVQYVHNSYADPADESDSTTATGRLTYQHSAVFAVPRLRFMSDYAVSVASPESGVDRHEWENRLDYTIGLVETSARLRLMYNGAEWFNLIHFRVIRHF